MISNLGFKTVFNREINFLLLSITLATQSRKYWKNKEIKIFTWRFILLEKTELQHDKGQLKDNEKFVEWLFNWKVDIVVNLKILQLTHWMFC